MIHLPFLASRPAMAPASSAGRAGQAASTQRKAPATAASGGDTLTLSARPYNALQRHGAFFDADDDHRVTVKETADGLVDLGLSAKKA